LARTRPPRELARNPQDWPDAEIDDVAARTVQDVAGALAFAMREQGMSLRQAAIGSGVNRQAIANLVAGNAWPDVATVARLEAFLGVALYPNLGNVPCAHGDRPLRLRDEEPPETTK
jgi:transcriptional regulator with XRE-family HTH domain